MHRMAEEVVQDLVEQEVRRFVDTLDEVVEGAVMQELR